MTARKHRPWSPPDKHVPRPPPKGDVNAIPWIPPAPQPLVFISELPECSELTPDAALVDVAANKVHKGRTVVIDQCVVQEVCETDDREWPTGYRVVDLAGLYLCPGLVDCRE